mmetsp:Transcript_8470/g.16844  ORF Transcript_8470/g.16844 Transcript_8470/m.16844 type:complete len:84 (+) Transcript_8470:1059-1310(+)
MRSRASETLLRTERPADWQRTHLALRFRLATPARLPGSSELREGSALGTYISLEHTELREILHPPKAQPSHCFGSISCGESER